MPAKRLAVIDRDLCKPRSCSYLCQRVCPKNRSGEECVTIFLDKKPVIDEQICFGCGICVKKCPTQAISVVNLPEKLEEEPIHRYGKNMFSLYRLPIPKTQSVVGLIGQNSVGKSTVINILAGNIMPNLGIFNKKISFDDINEKFKGSELQDYMKNVVNKQIKVAYKPQNIDLIPKKWRGKVAELLKKVDEKRYLDTLVERLKIKEILNKDIKTLSGGELQLLAISATILKKADFYFFDEPSSYLDIYERLLVAKEIRTLAADARVMVVEHDLAIADYLADYVHILYGKPGVFGIVSKPYGVRVGINTYLDGYIREENVRFRPEPIVFSRIARRPEKNRVFLEFPGYAKRFPEFSLKTEPGKIHKGEVIAILGHNAIGKTTFIKILAGELNPDNGEKLPNIKLSYKPQRLILSDKETKTVSEFLENKTDKEEKKIFKLLGLEKLLDRRLDSLSGGELQSVFITRALGEKADLLLLDEPSAFLDVEQRLKVAKILRSIAEKTETPIFVVDHDLQFIDALADRVMVFEGKPGVEGLGKAPCPLSEGMNTFLKNVNITFRRCSSTGRPRANKPDSQKDIEQKERGFYYYFG